MRIKFSVKRICDKCCVVRRNNKIFVNCRYKKHNQRQKV